MTGSVYVYGVVAADAAPADSGEGVGGSPVRGIRYEAVAALVSEVAGDSLAAPREVRAHWRVLEDAAADTTVLPVRFGTVMESDDAVREHLLAPNAPQLSEVLERLAGTAQLNIKGFYDDERLLREIVASNAVVAQLAERVKELPEAATYYDRIRLGEAVAAEVERARELDTDLFLRRLDGLAMDATVAPPTAADAAVNIAFLVRRSEVDRFSAAVAELEEEFEDRMRLRYVGPLPPYSFADVELTSGTEDRSWA